MTNPLLATDSYKQSHFRQYPPEARRISAYVEARPNTFSEGVLFFGLQAYLKKVLLTPITAAHIAQAGKICAAHGVPFNKEGWQQILEDHGGLFPLEIKALPEGTLAPSGVPLVQVENTDERMPWLTTWVETALLRAVWYPSTVATLSLKCKEIIYRGLLATSDDPDAQVPFKLHDFGARGVSSSESAALGGMAHLVNFAGTDTMEALEAASTWYGADMAGFSIPAAEHSTMTSWGPQREEEAYANMLTQFAAPGKLVAVVSDSYDIDNAVDAIWCGSLKERVLQSGATVVIRPDSGDPVATPLKVLETLWSSFGGAENSKGARVLNPAIRVIQGDGMTLDSIGKLVDELVRRKWSVDNIAFGMGGGLLQQLNRDTMRFAMKANAMKTADGAWVDVSKDPASDPGKASKAGRQAVIERDGNLKAARLESVDPADDRLKVVYRDGRLITDWSFDEVRGRANRHLAEKAAA
ncbi:nicotinate phosphoribosyltransferase [Roseibium sp. Sym1]|uniref:nicotinate phosphoribosyltransferase n=1 Tax=Roseibium sp. Sym1 TaxID=3016006 RepID=UPI0022B2E05B|nr:nicotinate phosphoribosyltransferase [Roseibium sp. Sym1]